MSQPTFFYKESGNASPLSISLSISSSLFIILFFSFFYSLLITYMPIVYFNFLIVAAYGFLVSFTSRASNTFFKIRNRKKTILITVALSILAVYFQWVSYIFVISFEDLNPTLLFEESTYFFKLLFRPDIIVTAMLDISKVGLWSLGFSNGPALNGIILWIIWLSEAAIIIFITINNYLNFENIPFSEIDNKWFKKEFIDFDFEHIAFKKKFVEELLENPSEIITSLKRGDGLRHSKISIFSSETESKSLITIDNIIVTQRGKGKKDITKVLEHCYIDNLHLSKLKGKFRTKKASIFDY